MMAALPYMQFYVADYLADTTHLTAEEHGAYMLLLFSYWQTGKPLRIDRLATVARIPGDRWPSVAETLSEFFHVTETHWVQFRVEADLEAVNSKVVTASNAGKASARAKAIKKQRELNDRSTTVDDSFQRNGNHTDTDKDTEHKKPVAGAPVKGKFDPLTAKPENVSDKAWSDWCQHRKEIRKPLTAKSCEQQAKALVGHPNPDQVLSTSISNGWTGIFPDKVTSNVHPFPSRRQVNEPDFDSTEWARDLMVPQ